MNKEIYEKVLADLDALPARSAWDRGVKQYALDILAGAVKESLVSLPALAGDRGLFHSVCLYGARDWKEYSYGACALVYDADIAQRLCTRTWLLQTDGGRRAPNNRETWLDVQAHALAQAESLLYTVIRWRSANEA